LRPFLALSAATPTPRFCRRCKLLSVKEARAQLARIGLDKDLDGWRPGKGKCHKYGREIEEREYAQRDFVRSQILNFDGEPVQSYEPGAHDFVVPPSAEMSRSLNRGK
jgi:hypothetical protein